ncbi:MAG TPA: hypothetical protein VF909_21220, partial [Roseiflexaceae bacterium]
MAISKLASATQNSKLKTQNSVVPSLLTFALVIGLWEAAVRFFGVPLYLLPAPSGILAAFLQQPGYLLQ